MSPSVDLGPFKRLIRLRLKTCFGMRKGFHMRVVLRHLEHLYQKTRKLWC
jgi:hypothetical protein